MLGDARIKMVDGRELTVPQYISYLKLKGAYHETSLYMPDESWREGLNSIKAEANESGSIYN